MPLIEFLARGVLVDNGYVLLCVNKKKKHLYLPGGHIEFAESAPAALIREISEELGYNVSIDHFLGAVEHAWKGTHKTHAEINLIFKMCCPSLTSSSPPVSREQRITFTWHPLHELTSIEFHPALLRTLLPEWIDKNMTSQWASSIE